jgi:Photosynthetic reaction centre cytochrome C subunit
LETNSSFRLIPHWKTLDLAKPVRFDYNPSMRPLTLCALFLTVTFTLAISAQEKGGKKGPNPFAGPYTNLKMLKPEQVQPAMMAARTGFGQACTYCHVQGEWASDANPKKAASLMMFTLSDEANAKFPADGKRHVGCYTCHRGVDITPPAAAPPAAEPAK